MAEIGATPSLTGVREKGRLTEPIAGVRSRRRGLLFMPLSSHSSPCANGHVTIGEVITSPKFLLLSA